MLEFSACMRENGVPKFPDPQASGELVIGGNRALDPDSPRFRAAEKACVELLPGGPPAGGPVPQSGTSSSGATP